MKERLIEFLRIENKSSAQLAEEIGVQASGISHIISGRNNPSLDFILKMLEKYKFLSTDWLLFGKGAMYKESRMQNLFDNVSQDTKETEAQVQGSVRDNTSPAQEDLISNSTSQFQKTTSGAVIKIVWFYENNSFREFFPE
jgi:transcriptional regulator with XRE-family HTH domain